MSSWHLGQVIYNRRSPLDTFMIGLVHKIVLTDRSCLFSLAMCVCTEAAINQHRP